MIYVLIYVVGLIAFNLWDAFIGFGFEFPKFDQGPDAIFTSLFWPVTFPGCLAACFAIWFTRITKGIKDNRLERQANREKVRVQQEKIRVQQEREVQAELEKLEYEDDAPQSKNRARSF